uniref:Uncharacterized protein n=1 Tax=Anguilla anguilla TaxID=7936 RepID=A0A0E9RQL5_ANGAN
MVYTNTMIATILSCAYMLLSMINYTKKVVQCKK